MTNVALIFAWMILLGPAFLFPWMTTASSSAAAAAYLWLLLDGMSHQRHISDGPTRNNGNWFPLVSVFSLASFLIISDNARNALLLYPHPLFSLLRLLFPFRPSSPTFAPFLLSHSFVSSSSVSSSSIASLSLFLLSSFALILLIRILHYSVYYSPSTKSAYFSLFLIHVLISLLHISSRAPSLPFRPYPSPAVIPPPPSHPSPSPNLQFLLPQVPPDL